MMRTVLRPALAIAILAATTLAPAQAPEGRFEKNPSTPQQMWRELKLERDLGNFEIAAKWLSVLLKALPTEADLEAIIKKPKRGPADLARVKDLLAIVDAEDEGAIAIARLAAVRFWSDNNKINDQAKADAMSLLRVTQLAQQIRATDEVYIERLIDLLKGKAEERSYAIRELVRLGGMAVPQLLAEYDRDTEPADRLALRQALERLDSSAVAPMLAGLDGFSAATKLEIIDLLRRKHAADGRAFTPFLWFPSADPKESPLVRQAAGKLIADLQGIPVSRLVPAKVGLTREAERYFTKDVRFTEPLQVWRWDGKKIVRGLPGGGQLTPESARTYYGLKFARQALQLDDSHQPAQTLFLGLAIQQASVGTAPGAALPASLASVINKADLPLMLNLFDRALREERTEVVLPLLRVIGARAETAARKPLSKGEPALLRALDYPDPRVRLAAVEAILAIPGPPPPHTVRRVLEVLRQALSPAAAYMPGGKVLVAIYNDTWRNRVVRALTENQAVAIEADSGRKAMRLLKEDASIYALVTESTLPYPGLAHFLGQVRADVGLKKLPILLAAVPETRESVVAASQYRELSQKRENMLQSARRFIEDFGAHQRERDESIRSTIEQRDYFPESLRVDVKKIDAEYDNALKELTNSTRDQVYQIRLLEQRHEELMKAAQRQLDLNRLVEASYDDIRQADQKFERTLAAMRKEYAIPAQSYDLLLGLERRMKAEAEKYDREALIRESALRRFVSRYPAITIVHTATLVNPETLRVSLSEARREAGEPLTPAETNQHAETAIRLLHALADGTPAGYDVSPLTDTILNALLNGRLSEAGQLHAVGIARRLTGTRPQGDLATVINDDKRPLKVRVAAADALLFQLQKNGRALSAGHQRALDALLARPGEDRALVEKIELLKGVLQGGARATGGRLLKYDPTPVPVLPVPKE